MLVGLQVVVCQKLVGGAKVVVLVLVGAQGMVGEQGVGRWKRVSFGDDTQ